MSVWELMTFLWIFNLQCRLLRNLPQVLNWWLRIKLYISMCKQASREHKYIFIPEVISKNKRLPYKEGFWNDVFKIARFVHVFSVMLREMLISKLHWMNVYTVKWVCVLLPLVQIQIHLEEMPLRADFWDFSERFVQFASFVFLERKVQFGNTAKRKQVSQISGLLSF